MEKYNADFFINFFEAIPYERWCNYTINDDHGRACAWGHIVNRFGRNSKQSNALGCLLIDSGLNDNGDPSDINNGADPRYQQSTPKQRIITALKDVKK